MKSNTVRLVLILTFVAVCGISVSGQATTDCPKISIIDPMQAVEPGEILVFSASIPEDFNDTYLLYIWRVNQGYIIRNGQKSVRVSTSGLENTIVEASVQILGLPKECSSRTTGSGLVRNILEGEPLDEFGDIPSYDVLARTDPYAASIQSYQESVGLVVNYGPRSDIEYREQLIAYNMRNRKIDLARIFFANCGVEKEIRTKLWIVPKGASVSPWKKCEFTQGRDVDFDEKEISLMLEKLECPTSITVLDPPIFATPGENLTFMANIESKLEYDNLKYRWTIDKGKIIEGQGTPTITVSTKGRDNVSTNATVKITGLPEGCLNSASGSAFFDPMPSPEFINEISIVSKDAIRITIESFSKHLEEDINATGYIVNYGKPEDISKREKEIRDLMVRTFKTDSSRFVFVNGGNEKAIRTWLWLVPAGADASEIIVERSKVSQACPRSISIGDPTVAFAPGGNQIYVANVVFEKPPKKIDYVWTVKNGKIIKGQGTPVITVSKKGYKSTSTTIVVVRIPSLRKGCANEASASGRLSH